MLAIRPIDGAHRDASPILSGFLYPIGSWLIAYGATVSNLFARLVQLQRLPVIGGVVRQLLAVYCIEIPREVRIGADLRLAHRGFGTVINRNTVIGDHVTIYHNVTVARADSWVPEGPRTFEPVLIADDAVLCPGVVVLGGEKGLRVGIGTVIGANAVLTTSTGDWEVWAGTPARKVGDRRDRVAVGTVHIPPHGPRD